MRWRPTDSAERQVTFEAVALAVLRGVAGLNQYRDVLHKNIIYIYIYKYSDIRIQIMYFKGFLEF